MTEFPNRAGRDPDLSRHILPSAATMVGICTTLIGLVKIIEPGPAPAMWTSMAG